MTAFSVIIQLFHYFIVTKLSDLQAYFTKKFLQILVDRGFTPAAWEEPWTRGTSCLADKEKWENCVRPKSDFVDDETIDIYAFCWNVDWEFDQTDWPFQFANNDYKAEFNIS